MNLNNVLDKASLLGISKTKIEEVKKLAQKYGLISNGDLVGSGAMAKNILSENGGVPLLDKALEKAKNPLIKMGLKKFGITDEVLNEAVSELKSVTNYKTETKQESSTDEKHNSITERLAKLK